MNTEALQKLPPQAFVENRNPDGSPLISGTDANVLCIRRGERGAHPMKTDIPAEEWNRRLGVTPPQREAMLAGSMFGWDAPAADPDSYDAEGVMLPVLRAADEPDKTPLKRTVYQIPGDPYGRNWIVDFPTEGVSVRGRTREDAVMRADAIETFLNR